LPVANPNLTVTVLPAVPLLISTAIPAVITVYKVEHYSLIYTLTIFLFFYGLGRAILKGGSSKAKKYWSFKRRNNKAFSNTPLTAIRQLPALYQPDNNYAVIPTV
jgi:ribose/xylose/arabinose/galactoside ABC-type transport system permease subunit